MVEPFYENKDAAKVAALEAAMNAPKLHVKQTTINSSSSMEVSTIAEPTSAANGMGKFSFSSFPRFLIQNFGLSSSACLGCPK